jgi:predicted RNA-binding Zn ribbon-like protein
VTTSITNIRMPIKLGGNLCLDFTNTAEYRQTDRYKNALVSYSHVLAWCWRANLVNHQDIARFQQVATGRPAAAKAAHEYALQVREAIYGVLIAHLEGKTPLPDDVACWEQAMNAAQRNESDDLTSFLWPVLKDAEQLLASDLFPRVKRCPGCGWLFLDTSRNARRRWCSPNCSDEAKHLRQHEHRRTTSENHRAEVKSVTPRVSNS